MQQKAGFNLKPLSSGASRWLIPMAFCLLGEFLWVLAAIAIAGISLPIIGLGLLLVTVVFATALYRQAPWLCPATAWLNFIGCAAIKTTPAVPHRTFQFFYMHSFDIALIVFAHLLAASEWRRRKRAEAFSRKFGG